MVQAGQGRQAAAPSRARDVAGPQRLSRPASPDPVRSVWELREQIIVAGADDRTGVAPEVDGLQPEPLECVRHALEKNHAIPSRAKPYERSCTVEIDEVDALSVERAYEIREKTIAI